MDLLLALPRFIIYLVSSLFFWAFSIIGGIVGIIVWPFKLAWGLLSGVSKLLISVLLAPTLLFSHPGNISSAAQPVVGTSLSSSNNSIEQIITDIKYLESAGRNMERYRNDQSLAQCGSQMQPYKSQAENLIAATNNMPPKYNALGAAAGFLEMCVSCKPDAQFACQQVRENLNIYKSMMDE